MTFVQSEGIVIEDFESIAGWTVNSGSIALSSKCWMGESSLRLTTSSNIAVATENVNLDLSSMNNLIFCVAFDDVSKVNYIELYFSNDSNFFNCKYIRFTHTTDWLSPFMYAVTDFNEFVVGKDYFNTIGAGSWSNPITKIRIRCLATAGNDISAYFDALCKNYTARPKCIISFDDAYATVLDAQTIMDGNSQKGVAFIVTTNIGAAGCLTLANCTTLYNDGWDISNHCKTHDHLNSDAQNTMEIAVNMGAEYLMENGFTKSARFFAYPYGEYQDNVLKEVKSGHKIGRTTGTDQYATHRKVHLDGSFRDVTFSCFYVSKNVSVATVESRIDQTIQQNGLIVLLFHKFNDAPVQDYEYKKADFQTISNYLASKSADIDVITFYDYYTNLEPSLPANLLLYLPLDDGNAEMATGVTDYAKFKDYSGNHTDGNVGAAVTGKSGNLSY
jgi:peptidoglycan/xylan/chitin deacetylase (PgdA/CDA1 family)